ncbi:MAG: ArsI/CadI family heavy metal resistance metalloenzyme [Pseudomonadota bacterium]
MKRFHVHLSVDRIEPNVRFYSAMFGAAPSVLKNDYAKWMLDDPNINFAISSRDASRGLNHLGFQLESDNELYAMEAQLREADGALIEEMDTACCYAKSDKYWVTDPQGVAWETFRTLGSVPVFGENKAAGESACCTPEQKFEAALVPPEASACCTPRKSASPGSCC